MLNRLKSSDLYEFVDVKTSAMILRIFASCFMIYGHGFGKIMNVFTGNFKFADPIGLGPELSLILAAFAEAICSFLILIGFWTRFASLVLIINMLVALIFFHAGDDFGTRELPLLYLLLFSSVFLLGPGKHSIDQTLSRA